MNKIKNNNINTVNNTFFVVVIVRGISKTGKYFPNPCWNRAESRYDGSQCLRSASSTRRPSYGACCFRKGRYLFVQSLLQLNWFKRVHHSFFVKGFGTQFTNFLQHQNYSILENSWIAWEVCCKTCKANYKFLSNVISPTQGGGDSISLNYFFTQICYFLLDMTRTINIFSLIMTSDIHHKTPEPFGRLARLPIAIVRISIGTRLWQRFDSRGLLGWQ